MLKSRCNALIIRYPFFPQRNHEMTRDRKLEVDSDFRSFLSMNFDGTKK